MVVELDSFRALFAGSIRAELAWDELVASDTRIRATVLADATSLGSMWTVWYANADGNPSDWTDAASRAMTVAEAARTPSAWTPDRGERIRLFRQRFREQAEPIILLLPAFTVEGSYLLLDSSHRAVAAYLEEVQMRALLLAIDGPRTPNLLPDLTRIAERMRR